MWNKSQRVANFSFEFPAGQFFLFFTQKLRRILLPVASVDLGLRHARGPEKFIRESHEPIHDLINDEISSGWNESSWLRCQISWWKRNYLESFRDQHLDSWAADKWFGKKLPAATECSKMYPNPKASLAAIPTIKINVWLISTHLNMRKGAPTRDATINSLFWSDSTIWS